MGGQHAYLVIKGLGSLANKLRSRIEIEIAVCMAKDEDGPIAQLARAHP
jgi:hypothetical protein